MIFPLTYRYEFCNKSQTPNKIPLIILSQKHAHCEHVPSLPFLLFNTYILVLLGKEYLSLYKRFRYMEVRLYQGSFEDSSTMSK